MAVGIILIGVDALCLVNIAWQCHRISDTGEKEKWQRDGGARRCWIILISTLRHLVSTAHLSVRLLMLRQLLRTDLLLLGHGLVDICKPWMLQCLLSRDAHFRAQLKH